ncbi:MAG: mevalonate kinase [Nitrososphaerales archaeon]
MNATSSNDDTITTSAPGKVILTGEHFVVHGSHAVAAAINKRARATVSPTKELESEIVSDGVTSPVLRDDGLFQVIKSVVASIFKEYGKPKSKFRIQIDSEIPQGSGLGSSAAIAVATSAALTSFMGEKMSNDQIRDLASVGEKSVHGNPSGIDTQASLQGGVFLFNRENGPKPIRIDRALQLLVVFSGRTRKTAELISKVNEVRNKNPGSFQHLLRAASFLSVEVSDALTRCDLPRLGSLIDLSQLSLSCIGVSTNELDTLIESLRMADALGAKITGAGGGGSVIALPKQEEADLLLRRISSDYPHSFLTPLPQEGLRWEM